MAGGEFKMKTYTYQITKYGYKVFCDGVCIRWAESDHKSGKKYNRADEINFIRAAQGVIHYLQAMDKYNMTNKNGN
jgi:hypothetical protein